MEKQNLNWGDALEMMESGERIRLPEWLGYWFMKPGSNQIHVFTRDGDFLDTPMIEEHKMRTDWQMLGQDEDMGFEWALLAMKSGKAVMRYGWNTGHLSNKVSLRLQVPDTHSKMGEPYFYATDAGKTNFPYQPTAEDLLAQDWYLFTDK